MYKKGKKISANEARGGNNQEDNIRKKRHESGKRHVVY